MKSTTTKTTSLRQVYVDIDNDLTMCNNFTCTAVHGTKQFLQSRTSLQVPDYIKCFAEPTRVLCPEPCNR